MNKRILALLMVGMVILGFTGCGESGASSDTTNGTTETESEVEEVIYPDDDKINKFLLAFNETYPELAITEESITPFEHHGSVHEDQILTSIDGMDVTISSTFNSGEYEVKVHYAGYQDDLDLVEANQKLFTYCMHVFNPTLSSEDIAARWQEVLDDLTHTVEWDDGTEFWPGPGGDKLGDYEYIDIEG